MIVLAFSLQSDVKSIGAYAGFAAIIGLALLVLLYFAQAREIRRLSDWLDEQENRLRAAPARPLMPRPGPAPAERAVAATPVAAPVAAAPEAGAATAATVAVPGVRRVAVGPGGAVGVAATAAPTDADAGAKPASGAVSAATVAGAMAAASAAGQAAAEGADQDVAADAGTAAPMPGAAGGGSGEDAPHEADAAAKPPAEGEPPAEGDAPAAGAAVPLSARPAATAEPVGAAQALGAAPGAESGSGGLAPDTTENAVVDDVEPGSGGAVATLDPEAGFARFAPPAPGAVAPFETRTDDAAAPFATDAAVEIWAERLAPDPLDDASSPAAPPPVGSADEPEASAEDAGDEPPVLVPSTPAGARPRFPPAPVAAGSTAVGVAAGVGAEDAGETLLAAGAAATTRRRGQDRPPPGGDDDDDDFGHHSPGSLLRLAAAAVVIVLVLIFIATRVFAPSKTTGLSPSKVNVAVLNGTPVAGLAGQVAVKLKADGFLQDGIANALSHGHHVTLVGYTPGNRAAAQLVAKDLGTTPTRVGPVDARTLAVAEALSATPPNVIATLGSDYLRR